MSDFLALEASIRRSMQLAAAVCATLLLVSAGSLGFAVHAAWKARQAASGLPVLVVPGAVAGLYSPGLPEEAVRGVARYLAGLGTNFSDATGMDERFDELESFASPAYLPRLQQARSQLRHEVQAQNQARVFFGAPGREQLRQTEPGRFEYSLQGQRQVYASGLAMDRRDCVVRLTLARAAPSRNNPVGLALEGFEVGDLAPADAAGTAHRAIAPR
jgi:hypothetical protein